MSTTKKSGSRRNAPARNNTSKYIQKKSPVFVHPEDWSQHELIINPQVFPFDVGDIVEIVANSASIGSTSTASTSSVNSAGSVNNGGTVNGSETIGHVEESLYLRVEQVTVDKVKITNNMQITILKSIADLYDLQPRKEVLVKVVTPTEACLDYVEISFKDHFISRSDMWRFTLFLDNKAVHKSKIITWNGIKAQVKELMRNGQRVRSGIILNSTTKITFRSRSAILYWMFQASKEMWNYSSDGTLYFEKAINGFAKQMFDKWRTLRVNHSLSIIIFSRYFLEDSNLTVEQLHESHDDLYSVQTLKDGRRYMDFYKVIHWNEIRQTPSQAILAQLRREFLQIHSITEEISSRAKISLQNSTAADGNFLEAVNLVLNAYDKYFVNRDLTRTGQEIVLISPGVGLFNSHSPNLTRITTRRLMDHGLSIDLICLAPPPLHSVPIFRYRKRDVTSKREISYYRSPDWINISFYRSTHYLDMSMASPTPPPNPNQEIIVDTSHIYDEKPLKLQQYGEFEPTCNMPNLIRIDLAIAFGRSPENGLWTIKPQPVMISDMSGHDDSVFRLERRRKKAKSNALRSFSHEGLNHILEISPGGNTTGTNNEIEVKPIDIKVVHEANTAKENSHEDTPPPIVTTISPRKSPRIKSSHLSTKTTQLQQAHPPKPLYNPFQLDKSDTDEVALSLQQKNQTNTFHRRRWAHLHPTDGVQPTQKSEYIKHFLLNINWQSLTEPACLPLTTDYWPGSALSNSEEFELNVYPVTDQGNYENNLEMFIRELVQQRLHEGFQLYVAPQPDATTSTTTTVASITTTLNSNTTTNSGTDIISPGKTTQTAPVTTQKKSLAKSGESSNQPVSVSSQQDESYSYYLCSANQFHHIACYRYNRNMVIINTYQYISEDQRKFKLQQQGVSAQLNPANSFYYRYMLWNSTLDRFEGRGNIRFKAFGEYKWNKLDYLICGEHRDMNFDLHNRCLQFHLIPISNSNRNYHNYPNTTTLLSSSSSLLNSGIVTGGPTSSTSPLTGTPTSMKDIRSELDARVKGFRKFFEAITGRNFRLPTNGEDVLDVKIADVDSYLEPQLYADTILKQVLAMDQVTDRSRPRKHVVKLERNVSAEESDRYEWIHFAHKSTYHPMECFFFCIRWLVCSSLHIDDYLQALTRRAKQCGFALVQTPVDMKYFTKPKTQRRPTFSQQQQLQQQQDEKKMQEMGALIKERVFPDGSCLNDELHPFRSFVSIPLHSIKAVEEIKKKMVEPPFNFIAEYMPVSISKRFIHESGCILLQFHPNHTLIWVENPFQSNLHLLAAVNPRDLLANLQKLCEPYQTAHIVTQDIIAETVNRTSPSEEEASYDVTLLMHQERTRNAERRSDIIRLMDDMIQ